MKKFVVLAGARKFVVAAIAAEALVCGSALAQENSEVVRDGVYVRIGAGVNFASDWEQDFTYNPGVAFVTPPPTGQRIGNGEGFLGAIALGFDYADGIRTELEYRYASTSIDTIILNDPIAGPTPAAGVNDKINAHFIMSNFYFDFYNSSRVTPFIGGGVGGALVENENGDRDGALAYQGRAGLSYRLGGGFSADLEYIYLCTNKLVYGPKDEDFTPTGAAVRIDGDGYEASNVMVSLRKQF